MMREFLFAGVVRDEREETGGAAVVFRTQNSSGSLGFFLARTKRAENLDENVGFGEVDGEVPHFGSAPDARMKRKNSVVEIHTPAGESVKAAAIALRRGATAVNAC